MDLSPDLLKLVRLAAGEVLGDDLSDVRLNANLRADLGVDSIDLFDILALLSKELEVDLDAETFAHAETVADFVRELERCLAKSGGRTKSSAG